MADETKPQPLVVRSSPATAQHYGEYLKELRYDFFYMCAYCTIMEAEAQAVHFSIDHYEPVSARPDLKNDYSNLMYTCVPCNTLKGDRTPPPSAQADGVRFYRPDMDVWGEHFVLKGVLLDSVSKVGCYTIHGIDLNRAFARRLREIRRRKWEADRFVAEGLAALRRFPIDQLPQELKGKAHTAIVGIDKDAMATSDKVDEIIREGARSELADAVAEPRDDAHDQERKRRLREFQNTYSGKWRGRK